MSSIGSTKLTTTQLKTILLIISIFFVALVGLLYLSVRKPLTSKMFVINTYGYVLAAILIVMMTILSMNINSYDVNIMRVFAAFILSMICIFAMYSTNSKIIKHIFWLSFVISMAVIMYPIYKKTVNDKTLPNVLITLAIITSILTLFVFFSERQRFVSWGGYLMCGLISLIIFHLLDILFFDPSYKKLKIYGMITVVLFSGFLLYDTDVLLTKSKNITNPDYPIESMDLFLDVANLFSGLASASDKH